MIDTALLHERIADRAEEFVGELFGDAVRRAGTGWRLNRRGSLAIGVAKGKLLFADFENGGGGDCVELWQRERGGTLGEALRACAAWVGLRDDEPVAPFRPKPSPTMKASRAEIPKIPPRAFDAWHEGWEWLARNDAALDDLAAWRRWPRVYVDALAGSGILAAPLCYGERARVAFQVATPETWPLGGGFPREHAQRDRGRFVGFHARMVDRGGEGRGWRYVPKRDSEHVACDAGSVLPITKPPHPGLPPLPLILSGPGAFGQIWAARLLIVCEGEFDALTLPLALGWFDAELRLLRIPPSVALVGIAGASGGPGALLDAYFFCWPHYAAVLVLRDSDKAGRKWIEPRGFLDALRARCARVESLHFGTNPDGSRRDVNDAFSAGVLTRELLNAVLHRLGTSLAEAESNTPPPA